MRISDWSSDVCSSDLSPRGLTPIQWLICAIAAIGFAFDIYEILMLPLIVRPALLELTGAVPGSPEYQMWVERLFYIPAFACGVFGRSEERRVGEECVSTCRSRWLPEH